MNGSFTLTFQTLAQVLLLHQLKYGTNVYFFFAIIKQHTVFDSIFFQKLKDNYCVNYAILIDIQNQLPIYNLLNYPLELYSLQIYHFFNNTPRRRYGVFNITHTDKLFSSSSTINIFFYKILNICS